LAPRDPLSEEGDNAQRIQRIRHLRGCDVVALKCRGGYNRAAYMSAMREAIAIWEQHVGKLIASEEILQDASSLIA